MYQVQGTVYRDLNPDEAWTSNLSLRERQREREGVSERKMGREAVHVMVLIIFELVLHTWIWRLVMLIQFTDTVRSISIIKKKGVQWQGRPILKVTVEQIAKNTIHIKIDSSCWI